MIVVDRIEGDFAVLEIAGRMVDVPLALLPPELRDSLQEGERLILARPRALAPELEELSLEELPLDELPLDRITDALEQIAPLQGSPLPNPAMLERPVDGAAILAALKAAHPQGPVILDL